MNRFYARVTERASERCEYCRAPEQVFNFAFEVEHILPRNAGGNDSLENLALACESCNLFKSSIIAIWEPTELRDIPLFHPRRDEWDDHFRFDTETAEIIGLTAIGRVTVTQLRMNSAFQIRARRQWMRLGLYP